MIYTTYFAKLRALPKNIVPIAICSKPPVGYKGITYDKLAPKYDFFSQWKATGDNDYFIRNYLAKVLAPQKPADIKDELYSLAGGADIALVCYEKPTDFCHRHLVSVWFHNNGIPCDEYVYDC
jgi:hypothetical protein